jgi:uncharacterized protein DUF4154
MSLLADLGRRSASSRIGAATIAVVLLMRALASAQDVTESALKAAFIYNFAKFTEWPADLLSGAEPFVLCVLGDSAVSDALERTVKARELAGHSLTVTYLEPGAPPRTCHVLYVSGVTPARAAQLVARTRDVPVLTISDLDGFTGAGAEAFSAALP